MRIVPIALLMALCVPSAVQAEPTGGRVSILSLRPYSGGLIYVEVSSGVLCSTSVFTFSVSEGEWQRNVCRGADGVDKRQAGPA